MRLKKVEDALDWAYRNGYAYAKEAAVEYASTAGAVVIMEDLDIYGYRLAFPDADTFGKRVRDIGRRFLIVCNYRGEVVGYQGTAYDAETELFK